MAILSFLKSSNKEIKKMNNGKVGAPFQYSDSYVQFLAFLKIGFKIPYRMVQGIVRGLSEYVKTVVTTVVFHQSFSEISEL